MYLQGTLSLPSDHHSSCWFSFTNSNAAFTLAYNKLILIFHDNITICFRRHRINEQTHLDPSPRNCTSYCTAQSPLLNCTTTSPGCLNHFPSPSKLLHLTPLNLTPPQSKCISKCPFTHLTQQPHSTPKGSGSPLLHQLPPFTPLIKPLTRIPQLS